jgi:hypothetical protein
MSLARRLFGFWFALWFTFVVTEPIPFHECAMHGPAALTAQAVLDQRATGDDVSALRVLCGQLDASHAQHSGPDRGHAPHGTHQCSCMGCCAGTPSMAVPRLAVIVPVPAEIARLRVVYPVVSRGAAARDVVLPPSTAPPV